MPSAEAGTPGHGAPVKRPDLARRSSSSVSFAKSPLSSLSSSAQRRPPQRHVVGAARMGSRNSSFSRVSKATKLQPVADTSELVSPQERVQMKRNSSNLHLTRNMSATALKKNHSETSLKKNKSSGQLARLPRAASSRHVGRAQKPESRQKRNSAQIRQQDVAVHPTVRFDLGDEDDEDDWTEENVSQSPSTKANTARNSLLAEGPPPIVTSHEPARPQLPSPTSPDEPEDGLTLKLKPSSAANGSTPTRSHTPPTPSLHSQAPATAAPRPAEPRRSESSNITSRLLQRNPSQQIMPQVSDVSATVRAEAHPPPTPSQRSTEPASQSTTSTMLDNSGQELVSRFLNVGSSSGTPKSNHFLPDSVEDKEESERMRRNQSAPNFARTHHRSDSVPNGSTTPTAAPPPSRTQQKLWLERDLSNLEPQQSSRPPSFLRPNRLSGLGLPIYSGNPESRFSSQQRQLHDQTTTEYKRVRLYQNPLASAVVRIQAKNGPRSHTAPKTSQLSSRVSFVNGTSASDGRQGLSQSWRSQRSSRSAVEKPGTADSSQQVKGRVRFGTVHIPPEGDVLQRHSLDGVDDAMHDRRDEARDICRRLWELHPVAGNND